MQFKMQCGADLLHANWYESNFFFTEDLSSEVSRGFLLLLLFFPMGIGSFNNMIDLSS